MRKLLFVLIIAIFFNALAILPTFPAQAQMPERMIFEPVPPLKPVEVFGSAWHIYAYGVIDEGAPDRLSQIIKDHSIPDDSIVFLNSLGGNLFAGMRLGRIFREHHFNSYIEGQGDEDRNDDLRSLNAVPGWGGKAYKSKPGVCVSACALAFLGGAFRYLSKGTYGVHRFFASPEANLNSDSAQIISAAVLQYIRDMGVDGALFNEMTKSGKDEMTYLPESRLTALGVVNNGVGKTSWTIETAGPYGLYLKGYRDTVFGQQKMLFMCGGKKNAHLLAEAIFDPKGNSDKITKMTAISFELDGTPIKIPDAQVAIKPIVNNGWINIMVALDDQLLRQLLTAKTIGIMAQFAFEAPVFQGIGGMDFTDGATKLPAFLKSCH